MTAPLATGTADLHVHTTGSDGLGTPAEVLAHVQRHTALTVLAITDHDDLTPALRAREQHARQGSYRFELVTGVEITTLEGHLLALFVEKHIPSFRSLSRTLDAVHRQGGLAVIPHPMSPLTRSIGRHGIERIMRRRTDGLWFDGIELANPSPAGRWTAKRARSLNDAQFRLSHTGGSDAHFLPVIASAITRFPGTSAAELKQAILSGTTEAIPVRVHSLREIGLRNVARQSFRALGATPSKVLGRPARRFASAMRPARAGGRG